MHQPKNQPAQGDEAVAEELTPQSVINALIEAGVVEASDTQRILNEFNQRSIAEQDIRVQAAGILADEMSVAEPDRVKLLPFLRSEVGVNDIIARLREGIHAVETLPEIPGFKLKKKLGKGGQGTVYLAEREGEILQGNVAIKIFKNPTRQQIMRMKREVNVGAMLPGSIAGQIVITHDAQPLPDRTGFYSVMEYVEGGQSLSDVERGEKPALPPKQVWNIVRELLLTLHSFEQNEIVHRDIKPANILVVDESADHPKIKIADFGLVKMKGIADANGALASQTAEGMTVGTPTYIDPDNASDTRFDVYSLGMTARALLTASRPFPSEDNARSIMEAQFSFSRKMGEFTHSQSTRWGRSATESTPEWVDSLKNPADDYARALAYFTQRASLPAKVRPLPSALIAELSEKFPDLMVDVHARQLVDKIRLRSRKIIGGVLALATTAAFSVAGLSMYFGGTGGNNGEQKGPKIVDVKGDGSNGNGGEKNGGSAGTKAKPVEDPVLPKKKFAEMTPAEQQEFLDSIALDAVGSPVAVDGKKFKLVGIDGFDIGPDNSAYTHDQGAMAGVFTFSKEHEKLIAKYFAKYEVTIVGLEANKRLGVWFRLFDSQGKDIGIFWYIYSVGTGFCTSSGTDGDMKSSFYPCVGDPNILPGLNNPDLNNLISQLQLPSKNTFVLSDGVGSAMQQDHNTDYAGYAERIINQFKNHHP